MLDTSTAVTALGLSGLVAALVAIVKALWPGTMPPQLVIATVALGTAALIALAFVSGEINGNAFQIVAQWLLQTAGAMGLREATVRTPLIGAQLGALPSRSG